MIIFVFELTSFLTTLLRTSPAPLYSGLPGQKLNENLVEEEDLVFSPSIYFMFWSLVLAMSTGIEAIVVTSPEIMEATKWQKIPSWNILY